MKKIFSIISLVIVLNFISVPVFAEEEPVQGQEPTQTAASQSGSTVQNPAEKLNRGIVNIVTAPIEIAKQIDLSWKKSSEETKSVSVGIFSGFFKGIRNTIGRAGSGIWDIVTFPFKTSENHEPLMKPEFVLDAEK